MNLPATISQLDAYSADRLRTTVRHTPMPVARTAPGERPARPDRPRRGPPWNAAGRRRQLALTEPTSP